MASEGSLPCLDLDDVLQTWAAEALGENYVVEDVDVAQVKVSQGEVTYHSPGGNMFLVKELEPEMYDNENTLPVTWSYVSSVEYPCTASWRLTDGVKSVLLQMPNLHIFVPGMESSQQRRLAVSLSQPHPSAEEASVTETFRKDLQAHVTVQPFSTSRASAHLKICKGVNVTFSVGILLSGQVKIVGHRKRKNWSKQEVISDISEILQTSGLAQSSGHLSKNNSKEFCLMVNGVCDVDFCLHADVCITELETLV